MKILFLFVDGLGLGPENPDANPCAHRELSVLRIFENGGLPERLENGGWLIPADATLGIDGPPQSATGQTTLFTGQNAARVLGAHRKGYPNEPLRDLLRQHSILKAVRERGGASAFLNVYGPLFFRIKEKTRWRLSTTTVANLSAGNPFFTIEDILAARAIYHDFTNTTLIKRGFEVPPFTPEEAAGIAVGTSESYDLLLYEYFLTDRAGHKQDLETSVNVLRMLDRFVAEVLRLIDLESTLVLLASDHGNIEDVTTDVHTRNHVPVLVWGKQAESLKDTIRTLEDVTPALLRLLEDAHA